jgi:hypothetical protein
MLKSLVLKSSLGCEGRSLQDEALPQVVYIRHSPIHIRHFELNFLDCMFQYGIIKLCFGVFHSRLRIEYEAGGMEKKGYAIQFT